MKISISLLVILVIFIFSNNILFNFDKDSNMNNWKIVDDSVMGGLSKGNMILNSDGHAVYSGFVTTDNYGGFSSIRYNFEEKDVSSYKYVVLKVKGDGKPYQFRIKQERYQRFSYIQTFNTTGEWEIIKIPFKDFYPSFRGYKLNRPNFNGKTMEEIAFLIGNKKKENFKLEIDYIGLE